jgi:hypothetical protein
MALCLTCGSYYKLSPYNDSNECDSCVDQLGAPMFDDEDSVEVDHLLNPSGRTLAKFSDE